MQSLILAGGLGTRLRPLTTRVPKPIVPFMNRPFANYQIGNLVNAGITSVTMALNHLPDTIRSILGDGADLGAMLTYAVEEAPLGTAGAFKFAAKPDDRPTVVLNGDILTDIDLNDMILFHKEKASLATLALFPVANAAAYGVVTTDRSGHIRQFMEKPGTAFARELGGANINAGIYILEPEILDLIPPNEVCSFEYDVFPKILELGLPFFGYVMRDRYWRDIGNPASYLAAHMDCLAGAIDLPFDILPPRAGENSFSIISDDCWIGEGVEIRNSVLGPGTEVENTARIENSVIWAKSRISERASITSTIVGEACHIGRDIAVEGAVLADETILIGYSQSV